MAGTVCGQAHRRLAFGRPSRIGYQVNSFLLQPCNVSRVRERLLECLLEWLQSCLER